MTTNIEEKLSDIDNRLRTLEENENCRIHARQEEAQKRHRREVEKRKFKEGIGLATGVFAIMITAVLMILVFVVATPIS